ncbi:MAG TPA: hypothetical protein VFR42_12575, partial [Candidatus Acidoferrum sp.]|nr:hypothetical protein [Candidatus Acidoferrum sp.]
HQIFGTGNGTGRTQKRQFRHSLLSRYADETLPYSSVKAKWTPVQFADRRGEQKARPIGWVKASLPLPVSQRPQ